MIDALDLSTRSRCTNLCKRTGNCSAYLIVARLAVFEVLRDLIPCIKGVSNPPKAVVVSVRQQKLIRFVRISESDIGNVGDPSQIIVGKVAHINSRCYRNIRTQEITRNSRLAQLVQRILTNSRPLNRIVATRAIPHRCFYGIRHMNLRANERTYRSRRWHLQRTNVDVNRGTMGTAQRDWYRRRARFTSAIHDRASEGKGTLLRDHGIQDCIPGNATINCRPVGESHLNGIWKGAGT